MPGNSTRSADGSNASRVVTQSPKVESKKINNRPRHDVPPRAPLAREPSLPLPNPSAALSEVEALAMSSGAWARFLICSRSPMMDDEGVVPRPARRRRRRAPQGQPSAQAGHSASPLPAGARLDGAGPRKLGVRYERACTRLEGNLGRRKVFQLAAVRSAFASR